MLYPKWVLVKENDGEFSIVIGKCYFHKELPKRIGATTDQICGGGWFSWSKDGRVLRFFGTSEDFGHAKVQDVHKAFFADRVFERSSKKFPVIKLNLFEMECYETKRVLQIEKSIGDE